MHGRFSELTGFACRWCLLALAGGAVALGSWTGLRGAGPAADGLRAHVAIADVICRRSSDAEAVVTLYHSDSPARRGTRHVLVSLGDATQTGDWRIGEGQSYVFLPRRSEGLIEASIVGLPYAQAAFTHGRAALNVVPQRGHVFLIDGHLALSAGAQTAAPSITDAWRRCMGLMAARGATALFHQGTVAEFASIRPRLRTAWPGIGVSYVGPEPIDTHRGFGRIIGPLTSRDKAINWRGRVTVVTDRRDVAVEAGRRGLATHLIGPVDKPIKDRDVTHHDSLAQFEQSLRDGPPGPGSRQ